MTHKFQTLFVLIIATNAMSACSQSPPEDKTADRGIIGSNSLQEMQAGIWTDPRGCDHWLIDDGLEGYLSARIGPDGKPVCSGSIPPEYLGPGAQDTADVVDPR